MPAVDGRAVKAVTFSTVKWPHLADPGRAGHDGPVDLIRCSLGRIGEEGVLQRDDEELVALAVADLAEATGAQGPPLDTRVTRWGGALPQYTVGHLDRVAAIRAGVAALPGLAVCGAAFDGIGIPACIGTARSAAEGTVSYLRARSRPAAAQPAARPMSGRRTSARWLWRTIEAWLRTTKGTAPRGRPPGSGPGT